MKPKETSKDEKKEPLQKFRCGQVTATIWEHEKEKDGKKFNVYSVEIVKNYTDKDDQWNKTSNYNKDDLAKVLVCVQEAMRFLYLNEEYLNGK